MLAEIFRLIKQVENRIAVKVLDSFRSAMFDSMSANGIHFVSVFAYYFVSMTCVEHGQSIIKSSPYLILLAVSPPSHTSSETGGNSTTSSQYCNRSAE